jgi:molybdopterin-guanine dinucleotide biosynthesis protein
MNNLAVGDFVVVEGFKAKLLVIDININKHEALVSYPFPIGIVYRPINFPVSRWVPIAHLQYA